MTEFLVSLLIAAALWLVMMFVMPDMGKIHIQYDELSGLSWWWERPK